MAQQILEAENKHVAEIEGWLDAEEKIYVEARRNWKENGYEGPEPERGFRCNWDSAKLWRAEGHTKLFALVVDGSAVAFRVGTDILEVKPNLRGNGYGRLLAEHMLQTARDEGRSLVKITIKPATAEAFWRRMGFTLVEEHNTYGNGTFAFRTLPKTFELGDGERVAYAISFFTQNDRFKETPKPFARFSGVGERLSDGALQLEERVVCFNPVDDQHVDYFVKIEIEGRTVYFDKVKYDSSSVMGVKRDAGYDYYLDRIHTVARAA